MIDIKFTSFMHLVVIILISLLKNGSLFLLIRFRLSFSYFEVSYSNSYPILFNNSLNSFIYFTFGYWCLLRMLIAGNLDKIFSATETFASNINSSTKEFVSYILYILTSVGLWVSASNVKLTAFEANVRAPASILYYFNFLAN